METAPTTWTNGLFIRWHFRSLRHVQIFIIVTICIFLRHSKSQNDIKYYFTWQISRNRIGWKYFSFLSIQKIGTILCQNVKICIFSFVLALTSSCDQKCGGRRWWKYLYILYGPGAYNRLARTPIIYVTNTLKSRTMTE